MTRSPEGRAARLAILAKLWDAIVDSDSPQEKLARRDRDQRLSKLDVREQGAIWLRVVAGEHIEGLLP